MIVGTIVNEMYKVEREIASGGMGDVLLATDVRTGQQVALKRLVGGGSGCSPESVARFVREHEALTQVDHPGIVRVYGTFLVADTRYMVMEFVEGGTIEDHIKNAGVFSVNEALTIGLDVADALARAHRVGIIHRDIKPRNILLSKDGMPRLTDFGIALFSDRTRLTEDGFLLGSLSYIPPETLKGDMQDARVDVWGLGVTLYEMLSGVSPFPGNSPAEITRRILLKPPLPLNVVAPGINPEVAKLVYSMLEKEPDLRVSSMRQVGANMETVLLSL